MSNIWFTSDTHFGHANIIRYCERPFADVAEMDAELIRRWNAVVRPEDTVYHLGDIAMTWRPNDLRDLVRGGRLNGGWVICKGNHDRSKSLKALGYTWFKEPTVIELRGRTFWINHYPPVFEGGEVPEGTIMLAGHRHSRERFNRHFTGSWIDVGVDAWAYAPVSLEEVVALWDSLPDGARIQPTLRKSCASMHKVNSQH